jgi:hypothetical protein
MGSTLDFVVTVYVSRERLSPSRGELEGVGYGDPQNDETEDHRRHLRNSE